MQEFVDTAYRLRSDVFASAFTDHRHYGLGLQKLLVIALYDTCVDPGDFQIAYERVYVIVDERNIGRVGRHGPFGFTVNGNVLL